MSAPNDLLSLTILSSVSNVDLLDVIVFQDQP